MAKPAGYAQVAELAVGNPILHSHFADAYFELKRIAAWAMSKEWASHSLHRTALVHEVFLRMFGDTDKKWGDRSCFFSAAANHMRQILVERARKRKAAKRGGDLHREPLLGDIKIDANLERVLHLDCALKQLASIDARAARITEMRVFAGLTNIEIGRLLEICEKTVERDWTFARAWLRKAISE